MVLDLTNIAHLSSAALSMLVTLKTTLEQADGRLCLACAGPEIMRVLRLCTLDEVVDILPDVDEAVERLS